MKKVLSFNDYLFNAFKAHCEFEGIKVGKRIVELVFNDMVNTKSPVARDWLEAFERAMSAGKKGNTPNPIIQNKS